MDHAVRAERDESVREEDRRERERDGGAGRVSPP